MKMLESNNLKYSGQNFSIEKECFTLWKVIDKWFEFCQEREEHEDLMCNFYSRDAVSDVREELCKILIDEGLYTKLDEI